jgi:hypothetical protein
VTAARINYTGSAVAALDQALNADGTMLSRSDGIARANVFALLAIAEQARITNLIAYKQLHTGRKQRRNKRTDDWEVDDLPVSVDFLTVAIENGLHLHD